jgi:hypothetical protein
MAGTSAATPASPSQSVPPDGCCAAQVSAEMPNATATAASGTPRRAVDSGASRSTSGSARITGASSRTPSTANGVMPRNTQRQPTCSVIRPAAVGPTSDGTTQAAASSPNTSGRLRCG